VPCLNPQALKSRSDFSTVSCQLPDRLVVKRVFENQAMRSELKHVRHYADQSSCQIVPSFLSHSIPRPPHLESRLEFLGVRNWKQ
jgi:hypothetical protein